MIEVPLSLPLDARMPEQQDAAEALLDDAQALVESYGVRAVTRLLRARRAGPAIVEEARRRNAELVVLGAPRRAVGGRRALFGEHRRLRPARVAVSRPDRQRQGGGMTSLRQRSTVALSVLLVALGLAVIARTVQAASAAGSGCCSAACSSAAGRASVSYLADPLMPRRLPGSSCRVGA